MVYLDNPIKINDIEIHHTYEGLKFMIAHTEAILKIATPAQLGQNERQHAESLLVRYKLHLKLYEENGHPTTRANTAVHP